MADEDKTKQAFTEAYVAGGKMSPTGLFDDGAMDDQRARKTLGLDKNGEGHADTRSGDITCDVDVKTSFFLSGQVKVACEKDGVALENPLSGAEQDQALDKGKAQQPIGYRGNGANYSVPSGRK